MSQIADIGNEILSLQTALGLDNPGNYRPGLTQAELASCALFRNVSEPSELHDLFAWRNGTVENGIPMGRLWIKPGFYVLSSDDAVRENHYCSEHCDYWKSSWFPLLTNGAGGRHFYDIDKLIAGKACVMNFDTESQQIVNQMYDSIESMLRTILTCYQSGAYFLALDGYLDSDFPREVTISRNVNPHSDYWRRGDLF
ncbi:MAG TPA: hypothetical protein VJ063_03760 [Verrucomicrobiae bacterium]|nr:hypothetical protein [Verrucomicrobiae bacterium]